MSKAKEMSDLAMRSGSKKMAVKKILELIEQTALFGRFSITLDYTMDIYSLISESVIGELEKHGFYVMRIEGDSGRYEFSISWSK